MHFFWNQQKKIAYLVASHASLSKPRLLRSKIVHFISFFNIPNSTQFSEYEKGQTIAYRKYWMSILEIARNINRSKILIYNLLKNSKEYG